MTPTPEPTIEQGAIRVSYVALRVDDPHAKVWEVDLHTKYAEVMGYGTDNNQLEVLLGSNDNTLRADPDAARSPTVITFPCDEGWTPIVSNIARYSFHVILYKRGHDE